MRNLKKVLSLTLALVMLLGMMVVGAGAAEYTDAGEIDDKYIEAVSVMSAEGVKILNGKDDSNFDPKGTLKRSEAAKIITVMLLGESTANAIQATSGSGSFTDVPADYWASGVIEYCANQGIIKGTSDTTFEPENELTGNQFAAMILRALGIEGEFTGPQWEINVVAAANKAKLVDKVTLGNTPISREAAAQLGFNGLKYSPSGEKSYVVNGQSYDSFIEAYIASGNDATKITVTTAKDSLAKTVFNLNEGTDTDEFGRDVRTWAVGDDVVYTDTASKTAAVKTYTTKASDSTIEKDLRGYGVPTGATGTTVTGIGTSADLSLARSEIVVKNNNTAVALGTTQTPAAAISTLTGDGKIVEIYATDKTIDKIIVMEYKVATVDAIREYSNRTTYKLSGLALKTNNENSTQIVLKGDVAEGDVVTYAEVKAGDSTQVVVYPTTSFTGTQTRKSTNSTTSTTTITVDGEQYVVAKGVTVSGGSAVNADDFANSNQEATYYVDVNGFVVKTESTVVEAPQYAMIVDMAGTHTHALGNASGYSISARVVLADGTTEDVELTTSSRKADGTVDDTTAENNVNLWLGNSNKGVNLGNKTSDIGTDADLNTVLASKLGLYAYTMDDGKMTLEVITAASGSMDKDNGPYAYKNSHTTESTAKYTGGTSNSNGTATALFTSSTVFVMYSVSNGKVTVQAPVTGTANLPKIEIAKNSLNAVVATNSTSGVATATASLVFLNGQAVAEDVDYAFVKAPAKRTEWNSDANKNVFVFDAVTGEGEEIELWKAEAITAENAALYVYDTDNKIGNKITPATGTDPVANGKYTETVSIEGNLIAVNGKYVDRSDAVVTFIADVDELENGQTAIVVMDSQDAGKVAAIFVTGAVPPSAGDAALGTLTGATLNEGDTETATLTAPTFSANTSNLTKASEAWSSDKTSIATVDATTGEVTFVADGSATITYTATLSNGATLTKTCTVTCNGVKGATLSAAIGGNISNGGTGTVTPTFTPNSSSLTVSGYEYESSDTSVATCTASGSTSTVTWVKAGTTVITVTATLSNGAKLTATVNVTCDA